MAEISKSFLNSMLKVVYDNSGVANDKYQASQMLSEIKKETFPIGEEFRYAACVGDGGNFGSSYEMMSNNPTDGARYLQWAMKQGHVAGLFYSSMIGELLTDNDKKAYMDELAANMSACYSGTSRTLATFLFGGVTGAVDTIQEEITVSQLTGVKIKLTSAGLMKLDQGSRIVFASAGATGKAVATSPLVANGAYATVTKLLEDGVEVTFQSAFTGLTIYKGDFIELYTARRGNKYLGIEGLPDLVPVIHNDRDESDSDWTNYIATDFRGVDRSQAVSRLAGQFVKAASTGDYRYADALQTLLKKGKKAGNRSSEIKIVINDDKFDELEKELRTNMWQSVNGATGKIGKTVGTNEIAVAFEDAFTNKLYVDPYCWYDKAYMYRPYDFSFADLGGVASKVTSPVGNESEGKAGIEAVGRQGFGSKISSEINVDKLFTVIPNGAKDDDGPLFEITAHIFGNFKSKETIANGVAVLD